MEENSEVKRVRRSSAEVERLVEQYEQSGMGQTQFCEEHKLALSTLGRGLRRRRARKKEAVSGNRLIGVEVVEKKDKSNAERRDSGLEVVLTKGRRIEVGADFDNGALERLVSVLERI